jgi:hypothetical protein
MDPPNDNVGEGTPGTPGYIPPTGSNTRLAVVVTGSAITFAEEDIVGAGGPWPAYTLKVTPVNDAGSGTPAEVTYPPPL